ncbi:unnamed protein product [Penicillium salamii]|nr:unnamed protein product [Penicillium salamii]
MSSFFKKPSWAKQTEADTEFYRRSKQTYSDIIAAHREAHQHPKKTDSLPEEPKKRRRISDEEKVVHEPKDPDNGECIPNPQLSSSPNHSSPGPIDRETTQSHSPEISSFVPPAKVESPKAPVSQRVPNIPHTETPSPPVQPSTPIEDPIVQIMISSEIENTTPLLVHRKMSQGLKEVRLAWCNRQDFAPETHPSIYLTWKGRRLFDVTTCRSLGLQARKSMALLSIDDDPLAEQEPLRIHLEAVTEGPILTNRPSTSDNKPHSIPAPAEDDQDEPKKLILRSPGLEDFKIKARQKTLISRLISAFRDKQNIPSDHSVTLVFDGDNLPPDSCLGDHDIDNLDLVDVMIRPGA